MPLDPFDPVNLRLDPGEIPSILPGHPQPRPPRKKAWFLRGPVPWPWIACAARLPGQALHVGLILWREHGRRRGAAVRLNLSRLEEREGLARRTAVRGVQALEAAGLVTVTRHPGRALEVALCEIPEEGGRVDSCEPRVE